MNNFKNINKVGIILSFIIGIILFVLILYIKDEFLSIKPINENRYDKTMQSEKPNYFVDLTAEDKIVFNELLNEERFLKSFNLLLTENPDLYNVNLLQNELNKFKFIFIYFEEAKLSFEKINEYSNILFNTDLYEKNLSTYLERNHYIYSQDIEKKFCLKAIKEKNDDLILDIIKYDDDLCKADNFNYEKSYDFIKLKYKINNNDFILKSFIKMKEER